MSNIITRPRTSVASAAKAWLRVFGAALLLLCFDVRQAHAVAITLGSRIDLTPTTFALPIQIVDAMGVSEWSLDLTYDPTDVQVNVGCDPFGGDIYCSLLTGPVTEGDFFAAGAPFNLLVPGFVELDPITLEQSGRLFGMYGAFGGSTPAPSGSGILAYIEFTLLGTGNGPIEVGGSVVSVPEPGSLALLATGLAWMGVFVRGRRRRSPGCPPAMKRQRSRLFAFRRRAAVATCIAMASLSMSAGAIAQAFPPAIELPPDLPAVMPAPTGGYPPTVASTAAGAYSAPPAWSQTLAPSVRFVLLSNFNSDAVLDRETGLVWSRRSKKNLGIFSSAFFERPGDLCRLTPIGDRFGWRLPAVAELQSLVDTSVPLSSGPSLPVGHPFLLSPSGTNPTNTYWTREAFFAEVAGERVLLRRLVELQRGLAGTLRTPQQGSFIVSADILCVRGGPTPAPNAPDPL